jgi:hypothetical protein
VDIEIGDAGAVRVGRIVLLEDDGPAIVYLTDDIVGDRGVDRPARGLAGDALIDVDPGEVLHLLNGVAGDQHGDRVGGRQCFVLDADTEAGVGAGTIDAERADDIVEERAVTAPVLDAATNRLRPCERLPVEVVPVMSKSRLPPCAPIP